MMTKMVKMMTMVTMGTKKTTKNKVARSKSDKYTGGGVTLLETRIQSNMDVYDVIRLTIPYMEYHHNMVRW